MKVYIKNKIVSWGGSSSVVNAEGKPVYTVKGKVFTFTSKKTVCDLNGNKLFKVRNKFLNFFVHKAYIYNESGKKIARVKDKFFNFKNEYFVTGYGCDLKVEGHFFSLTCQILRNGEVIGTIRRQITLIADAFELEADERDIPFLIALVIAIDNIVDKKTKT